MVPRPGVCPAAVNAATRCFRSTKISSRVDLPSNVIAPTSSSLACLRRRAAVADDGDPLRSAPPNLRSPLRPVDGDPLRSAPPNLRPPLRPVDGDPLRSAPPNLRSPLRPVDGDPLRSAPPNLRSP